MSSSVLEFTRCQSSSLARWRALASLLDRTLQRGSGGMVRVAHRRRRNAFWEDFATANDNFCLERRFGFGHTIHHHTMQKHFYSGGLPLVRQFSGLGDSWESAQVQVPQQGRIAHRPPAVVDLLQDRALQYERFGSCFSDHDGLCTAVHCCALRTWLCLALQAPSSTFGPGRLLASLTRPRAARFP